MSNMRSWHIKGGESIQLAPFFLVGILNITPDSFYDGDKYFIPEQAIEHACKLKEDGANMLDIGAESSRPGSEPISAQDELQRLIPIFKQLQEKQLGIPISVDTYRASTATYCLEHGASVINDISACSIDPELLQILIDYKPGYVLMHAQGNPKTMQHDPKYNNVVEEVYSFLEEKMGMLVRSGFPEENIVLDPGIGFGKTLKHNLLLLQNIEKFARLGRPVYIGLSNKSLWSKLLQVDLHERKSATLTATVWLAEHGVFIHRLHQIKPAKQALTVLQALNQQHKEIL